LSLHRGCPSIALSPKRRRSNAMLPYLRRLYKALRAMTKDVDAFMSLPNLSQLHGIASATALRHGH